MTVFRPEQHPRGGHGQFAFKSGDSGSSPHTVEMSRGGRVMRTITVHARTPNEAIQSAKDTAANDPLMALHFDKLKFRARRAPSDTRLAATPGRSFATMSMSKGSGRHNYNPQAVNQAIASSNRAGRRIGGKEARLIHRLLKGR